jgi:hypothetical protein
LNNAEQSHQRDSSEGIDVVKFARIKLAQALKDLVRNSFLGAGGVLTPEEFVATELPDTIMVPHNYLNLTDYTVLAFKLRRDSMERLFFVALPNKPDGQPDIMGQGACWQEEKGPIQ